MSFILKLIPGGKTARLALAIALVAGISWVVHYAYTLYQTKNSVTVSPATVDLSLNRPDGAEALATLTMTGMRPGADAYVGVTVANTGTSDFWFTMSSTASGDGILGTNLTFGMAVVPSGGCNASGYASGTALYRDARGLSVASVKPQPLAGGDSDYLCFHVQLPPGAAKPGQGSSADDTLNFTAQQ